MELQWLYCCWPPEPRPSLDSWLLEMEREPRNAQVVVQDSGEDSVISLIDESGIICTYNSCEYVSREHGLHAGQPADETLTREEPSGVRSALHDTGDDLVEVKRALEAKGQELQAALERLREVEKALDAERRNYQQKDVELTEARSSLEREKRKVKEFGERNATYSCRMKTRWTRKIWK